MNRGHLSDYFSGVVVKRLSAVETDPATSNQHEFNGSLPLRRLFGDNDRRDIPTKFLWIGEEQESVGPEEGFISWYDARRNHPTRTEYRLYYNSNDVTRMMQAGDAFFLAIQKNGDCLIIFTPSDSTMYNQLLWLFGIDEQATLQFNYQSIDQNSDTELGFAARLVLETLDIDPEEPEGAYLDRLIEPFGSAMPKAMILSQLARDSLRLEFVVSDPDKALLQWMERELQLFRRLERRIVRDKIERGFVTNDGVDVDGFLHFSLSVQNRRKSRAGLALESHVEALLKAANIRHDHGAITENRNKPDFLFPGKEAYHNPNFPSANLSMLGAKSTLKDRWRQVLSEATRIENKHLLTLEPGISEMQTDEMRAKNLQLVIPQGLHESYKPQQQSWLMNVAEFIDLARHRQLAV